MWLATIKSEWDRLLTTIKGCVMENLKEPSNQKTYAAPKMVVMELKRQEMLLQASGDKVCEDCVFQ